jgi:hypothetical protein
MGALLSNLSKLDSVINPDTSVSTQTADTAPKSEETTNIVDSTVKESDTCTHKESEPEPVLAEAENVEEKLNTKEESYVSDKKEEGRKVEVEPVNVSNVADVITKPIRKRKKHHMA